MEDVCVLHGFSTPQFDQENDSADRVSEGGVFAEAEVTPLDKAIGLFGLYAS